MSGRLTDKTAIITGGAGGIGCGTAKLFCAEGARVVLVDRDDDALAAAVADITAGISGTEIATVTVDISHEDEATRAVSETVDKFGGVDVLVNNAGIRKFGHLTDATNESWQDIISVNLLGTVNCAKAAMQFLRKSATGNIVNVSSVHAEVGRQNMGQYDATKAAINSMTRTWANEEAAHGVRVNAVCPGGTLTPYHQTRYTAMGLDQDAIDASQSEETLLRRWARIEEIAYPILWLASAEASFITGSILMVDGGKSAM
jgi:meso-butanediol dehydrogenase/(S,S)-butanediol dehydrogenase/diacetyl reductase